MMSLGIPASKISITRRELTFVEGFMSYFSKKYRKSGLLWEFYWDDSQNKKVVIPFRCLWTPGLFGVFPGRWDKEYCMNRPCMQLTVAIDNAKNTLKQLEQRKKEAADYETQQIELFGHHLNAVVTQNVDGKLVPMESGAGYKPTNTPKNKDVKRMALTSSSDPRGGQQQQQKKGGQQ
jgi:hypothetical protein